MKITKLFLIYLFLAPEQWASIYTSIAPGRLRPPAQLQPQGGSQDPKSSLTLPSFQSVKTDKFILSALRRAERPIFDIYNILFPFPQKSRGLHGLSQGCIIIIQRAPFFVDITLAVDHFQCLFLFVLQDFGTWFSQLSCIKYISGWFNWKRKLDQVYCAWLMKWVIKREILGQYGAVLVGTWWYLVSMGRSWLVMVLGATGSVWGGTG